MIIQTWIFGKHFLENEQYETLQGEQLTVLVVKNQI